MPIGWIDFSKTERNKVLNVIHRLEEPGAVDELGFGTIRDGFADRFFPGTSTVQTRAKYFLIVPYILLEAGRGKYGSDINSIIRKIDDEERKCRDMLVKTSTTGGIIGSLNPQSWVVRTPLSIYWSGIKRLGIFKENLTVKEYIRQSIIQEKLKREKESGNRNKDAEENEKDDMDAGDAALIQFWDLGDLYCSKWRNDLTIELLPKEAKFLKTQIISSQRGTLFAYLLSNQIPLDKYDSFGALSEGVMSSVGGDLRYMIGLANDFNNLASIITTRYNLIVFDGKNKRAQDNWNFLSNDLKRRSEVDLHSIFKRLCIENGGLKAFLQKAKEAIQTGDIDALDGLIKKREFDLKDKRAKTSRIGEYTEENTEWIGLDVLDYRFTPAKRIIRDIMNAEALKSV